MSSTPYADADVLGRSRRDAVSRCAELGRPDLADDAALVMGELVTNALLHGGGCTGVGLEAIPEGVRIEVRDGSRLPPMLGRPTEGSLTGRGLRLVDSVSARWGADAEPAGKVVWAEVTGRRGTSAVQMVEADILAMWDDDTVDFGAERRYRIELGEVPTDLLLSAKSHVDNLVREFTLASAGALTGQTAEVPEHLRALLTAVVDRFAEARLSIKRQALAAAASGLPTARLVLDLPASAAGAAEAYVSALDEIDAYCRARRLLTLETAEQHRTFRRWYVEELVKSLRAAAAGQPLPKPQTFERRLLAELDRVAEARRVAERSARLYSVAAALATAATPESVAHAMLNEGVAALGAAAGGVLLAADDDRLVLPGAVGYDETVLARLRAESRDAELPAAVALRTGESVWLESAAERDERFPELVGLEQSTVALCAVPLEVQGRQGALHFSFSTPRLFDEDERRFVRALAAQTAQALERTQLQRARVDVSRRLQRSLLPPSVPEIEGLEVAAIYQPFGDEMDVGGDFYDIWAVRPGCWAIAIGDAAGTGPEAAALTALVRHTLRALSLTSVDPVGMMRMLNAALLDAAPGEEGERFCTALLGLITVSGGVRIELATGGHPPPIVRRAAGTIETLDVRGSLLGVLEETEVWTVRAELRPGDTLVAVTDGVLEARRAGRMFDVDGIVSTLSGDARSAREVADALQQAVLDHVRGSLTDDMAAIVLHVPS
ncbi:MAG: SpoIIE family protein phosphatase [Acidimicrobiia bacterium]